MLGDTLSIVKNVAPKSFLRGFFLAAMPDKRVCKYKIGVHSSGLAPILFFQTEYNLYKTGCAFTRSEKAFILSAPDPETMACTDRVVRKSRFYSVNDALVLLKQEKIIYQNKVLTAGDDSGQLMRHDYVPLPTHKDIANLRDGLYTAPPGCNRTDDFTALITLTLPYLYSVLESFPEKQIGVLIPQGVLTRARAHAYRYIKQRYPHVRFVMAPPGAAACRVRHLLRMERNQNAPPSFIDGRCLNFIRKALPQSAVSNNENAGRYYIGGSRHKVVNEAELTQFLAQEGFKTIDANSVSPHVLASIFASAEMIVGADSSAFSHLIYAQPHCAVAIFYPQSHVRDANIWLAKSCGLFPSHMIAEQDENGVVISPEAVVSAMRRSQEASYTATQSVSAN